MSFTCKYCGKTFEGWGHDPSDFGLHYNVADVYDKEFTCASCNSLVTITNRLIKDVLNSNYDEGALTNLAAHVADLKENRDQLLSEKTADFPSLMDLARRISLEDLE